MAKSRSKYARQRTRAKIRKRRQRRGGAAIWYSVIAVVVLGGIMAIVLTREDKSTADMSHRHAVLGVNVCGTWQSDPTTPTDANGGAVRFGTTDYAGLHAHDDGLIHFEPQSGEDAGSNATVGRFFRYSGWKLDEKSISYASGISEKNGDKCPDGKPGVLRWAVAENGSANLKERHGNPADYAPKNDDVVGIYFVSKSQDLATLGAPPSLKNLPDAATREGPPPPSTPQTLAPGVTLPPGVSIPTAPNPASTTPTAPNPTPST